MTQPAKRGRNLSGDFFSNFKRKARYRNIEWDLTLDDLDEIMERQNFKCPYTGETLSAEGYKSYNCSLDRISSDGGYTKDNVQFVLKETNMMKWVLSEDRFLELVEKIYKHRLGE